MHAEIPDESLMLAYRDGDAAAFEEIYRRHGAALYRYMRRQCGEAAPLDEMFQDVWLNLIKARRRYESRAKFRTYLYQMARNRIVDHFRRHATSAAVIQPNRGRLPADAPVRETDQPERRAELDEDVGRVMAELERLPPEQREAFLLHEEGGLGIAEIAGITGVNAETAKSRLRYAVQKLRRVLTTPP